MADPNKFAGLLDEMGIMTPTQKSALQYQQQLAQLQMQMQARNQAMQAGQMAAPGGFGYPAYLAERAVNGGGGNMQIPQIPGLPGTSKQEQIMAGTIMGNDLPSQGGIMGNYPKAVGGPQTTPVPSGPPAPTSPQPDVPYSQKLRMAAQQLLANGDTAMAQKALAASMEAAQEEQKASYAEQEAAAKASKEARDQAQAGNVGNSDLLEYWDGSERVTRIPTKDANGKITGYTVERGRPSQTSYEGGKSKSDESNSLKDWETRLADADTAFNQIDKLDKSLASGTVTGWTKTGALKADNFISSLGTFVSAMGKDRVTLGADAQGALDTAMKDGRWREIINKAGVTDAQFQSLTYSVARALNKTGTLTKRDIEDAAQRSGRALANPTSARAVLKDLQEDIVGSLGAVNQNRAESPNNTEMTRMYERFLSRHGRGANDPAADPGGKDAGESAETAVEVDSQAEAEAYIKSGEFPDGSYFKIGGKVYQLKSKK